MRTLRFFVLLFVTALAVGANGGGKKTSAEDVRYYRKAAERGDVEAQKLRMKL